MMRSLCLPVLTMAICVGPVSAARATDAGGQEGTAAVSAAASAEEEPQSAFDRLWELPTAYRDDDGPVLNELRIVGRVHIDGYVLNSDMGDASDIISRRARIGVEAQMFDRLEVSVEADVDLEGGPLYVGLTDAYAAWEFSDAARVTVGKQSVKFTLDGSISSNSLLTVERSALANNFWFTEEYAPGISFSGEAGPWSYNTGIFSGGSAGKEFGGFDAGMFGLVSGGYDFAGKLGAERALLRADYVYNEPDPDSGFTRPYEHIASLVFMLDNGDWGVSTDLTMAEGFPDQSDGLGGTAMPWVDLTDDLTLVLRYTYLESEEANGLRHSRYQNAVSADRGDRYHEFHGGLDYRIYGNRLKLQTGVTYADMDDEADDGGAYEGLSWVSGLRVSW